MNCLIKCKADQVKRLTYTILRIIQSQDGAKNRGMSNKHINMYMNVITNGQDDLKNPRWTFVISFCGCYLGITYLGQSLHFNPVFQRFVHKRAPNSQNPLRDRQKIHMNVDVGIWIWMYSLMVKVIQSSRMSLHYLAVVISE